ncbi:MULTISPECIES: OmpA family protein [Marinobacter]|uniref:OmpA family protein n=1 Tax=Marinobacter suaedae TaxID=3057675 RepID=A0ABT8W0Z2_9GAMM|nr:MULTISPECIES: OmpA family protein [unclassified Marinobacter]MBZ2169941.1 OmpA family protein [Marinobacter sp. F4216]MDO3721921.1 OmpA family protein [Marinobacter sp. chi1]
MNRLLSIVIALGLATLFAGCSSTPPYNQTLDEARSAYLAIEQDPDVARSGAAQLRSSKTQLEKAEMLLEEDADIEEIEHASYLALRHAEIAQQQGLRAALEEDVSEAEERRNQIMLNMKTQEAADLRAQMAAMQAEQTERGMVLTLGDVLFDVGKADLKPSAQRTIDQLAGFMKQYEERRVRIEGYTDSTGDEAFNQRLSERRAMSVYEALLSEGISSSRIEVEGYGEAYPKASNDTSSGRQQNRRVEVVISDQNGVIKGR